MGTKKARIAGLPPEIKEHTVKEYLTKYGEIIRIRDELWAAAYRYKVYNGVRIAEIKLEKAHTLPFVNSGQRRHDFIRQSAADLLPL